MADRYAITGTQTSTPSPGDTVLGLEAGTTTRARITEFNVGSAGAVSDSQLQWLIRRFTAVGTRSAVTPTALDPGAPAALLAGAENHTVEPTYTAGSELFDEGIHQRTAFRFIAAPTYEFVVPATANNGIGITPIHASYADAVESQMLYEE